MLNSVICLFVALSFFLVVPLKAYAYFDPAVSGMILNFLAIVFGGAVFFVSQIRTLFSKMWSKLKRIVFSKKTR
tara:strand:+ start:106 stop:327 length:222 start_codon:yes stop_codon:yes gene_type:complete